jgi:hypothetical protein
MSWTLCCRQVNISPNKILVARRSDRELVVKVENRFKVRDDYRTPDTSVRLT